MSDCIGDARLADPVAGRLHGRLGAVGVAQLLDDRVDVVAAGRGRRPGVVDAASELDEQVGAGERDPAGLDARTVEHLLDEQLRRVVAGLRSHHREWLPGLRLLAGDEQRVAHAVRAELRQVDVRRRRGGRAVGFTFPGAAARAEPRSTAPVPAAVGAVRGRGARRRAGPGRTPPPSYGAALAGGRRAPPGRSSRGGRRRSRAPRFLPNFALSACHHCAFWTSWPPPLPKMPPTSEAT